MERETSLGEEEVAWEQGWWVGSVWKNTQEAETRGKACEGGRVHGDRGAGPSGCSWGTAREAGRLMEPAATPGEAESRCPGWHGAQTQTPCPPPLPALARPTPQMAPGRKLAPSRPRLRSCRTLPSLQLSRGRRGPHLGLRNRKAQRNPSRWSAALRQGCR